jgi:hypothetical protein
MRKFRPDASKKTTTGALIANHENDPGFRHPGDQDFVLAGGSPR